MSQSTIEKLREDFETYGVNLDDKLLLKCSELCTEYNVDGEEIAAIWIGYSANHGIDEVSIDHLDQFAKDELSKNKKSVQHVPKVPIIQENKNTALDAGYDDLLAAYGASPSASNKIARTENTPDTRTAKRLLQNKIQASPLNLNAEASTPSQKYSSRSNSGTVVATYGTNANQNGFKATPYSPKVSILSGDAGIIKEPYMYMFEKVKEAAMVIEDKINLLADQMKDDLKLEEWISLQETSNESAYTVGNICCDSVGRLNAASVLLESCREVSNGQHISLNLSRLQQYSLFPGQVIAAKGVNSDGRKMLVEEIQQGKVLPFSDSSLEVPDGGVQIMVACGPFTSSENLLYEPLNDLLTQVQTNPPHVLILLGPLLDASHPQVLSNSLSDSYNSVVNQVVNTILTATSQIDTQVIIVSSSRDITCIPIYPTPPYNQQGNCMWLSDPSLIDIDGIVIGITSTDVLLHLGKEEISFPPQSSDRLSRLTRHILAQQSLYPLYPPPEGMSIDIEKCDSHARLTCTPHMLILPSELRYFIKDVEGCVVVNPERITKGAGGGSYARIEIKPQNNHCGSVKDVTNAIITKI